MSVSHPSNDNFSLVPPGTENTLLSAIIIEMKSKVVQKWRSGVGYISLSAYLYLSSCVAIYQKIYRVVHQMVSAKFPLNI